MNTYISIPNFGYYYYIRSKVTLILVSFYFFFVTSFCVSKILQADRFGEVQQPAMQRLCSLHFYLVAEQTRLQGLLLRFKMPLERGLHKLL